MNKPSDFLKIMGILTMLMDHVGAIFFPQVIIFRIVGRLAFPIFAYHIALGYINTKNLRKYSLRLLIFGLLSQAPYSMLFNTLTLNIFFTLLLGLLAIVIYDRVNHGVGLLIPLLALIVDIDFGIYGVYVVLFFFIYYQQNFQLIMGQSFLSFIYCMWHSYYIQMYSVLALGLILLPPINLQLKLNKYWFYGFYPGHLILLLIVKSL